MRKPNNLTVLAIGLAMSLAAARPTIAAGDDPARGAKAVRVSQQELELKINQLQEQNRTLEVQNRSIQEQLNTQKQEIDTLMRQMQATAQPVVTLQQQMPRMQQELSDVAKKQRSVPLEVGFRTGWAESPYDMPGGFFYGAYLNHRLLTAEDGIPGGFVSGELMAGVVLGNHATTGANLYGALTKTAESSWLDTIEIQPTVQYHLDPTTFGHAELAWFKPYVLAGPGMWIDLLSTPVTTGKMPGERYRHYDADFQGGGVFGLGTELSLSMLNVPAIQRILEKSMVGAEWRYNQLGNGEAFQQYTGSVSFGW